MEIISSPKICKFIAPIFPQFIFSAFDFVHFFLVFCKFCPPMRAVALRIPNQTNLFISYKFIIIVLFVIIIIIIFLVITNGPFEKTRSERVLGEDISISRRDLCWIGEYRRYLAPPPSPHLSPISVPLLRSKKKGSLGLWTNGFSIPVRGLTAHSSPIEWVVVRTGMRRNWNFSPLNDFLMIPIIIAPYELFSKTVSGGGSYLITMLIAVQCIFCIGWELC